MGFFYLGSSDRVLCFSCIKIFSHWNYGNSVTKAHKNHSPLCEMARRVKEKNDALLDEQRESVPYVNTFTEPPDVSEGDRNFMVFLYPLQTPRYHDIENEDRRFATLRLSNTKTINSAGFFYIVPDQRVECWCSVVLWNVRFLVMSFWLSMLSSFQLVTLCCKEKD